MDIDAMIAAARKRIYKRIEARCQVANGRKASSANRSAGQLFKRGPQMPGDVGDDWRAFDEFRKQQRKLFGVECPGCRKVQPKRDPTILLPGQRCRVCGHQDPRPQDVQGGQNA